MKYNHIHSARKKRNVVLKRIAYKKKKVEQIRFTSIIALSVIAFIPKKYKSELTKLAEARLAANIVKGISNRKWKYYLKKADEISRKNIGITDLWEIAPL